MTSILMAFELINLSYQREFTIDNAFVFFLSDQTGNNF